MLWLKRPLALLGAVLLITPAIGRPSSAPDFKPPIHLEITREGLSSGPHFEDSFLNTAVRRNINHQHAWMDGGIRGGDDEKHFDDCEFNGAAKWIRGNYSRTRQVLTAGSPWAASTSFGRVMHTVQDFYSHSNWVELGFPASHDGHAAGVTNIHGIPVTQADLVDLSGAQRSLAQPWYAPAGGQIVRGDILLGSDDWAGIAKDWRIDRNGGGRFVPTLISPDGRQAGRLLETGRGSGDDECKIPYLGQHVTAYTGIKHEKLNKDCPTCGASEVPRAERRRKFLNAQALATLQTGYEWCRLVREAAQVNQDGLLLATWVRPGGNPHPPGTPCQAQGPGPVPVVVTIESVRILDTGDPSDEPTGEIQLAAALYDDPLNFHRSVHVTNRRGRMLLRRNDYVPANQLPAPLTLCVPRGRGATFTLHAWDNDDPPSDEYALEYDRFGDEADELLVGFQRKFGDQLPSGVQVSRSADLEVRYRVSRAAAGQPAILCPRDSGQRR